MARLRKWVAYRDAKDRPYTRYSKFRKKAFVKAKPGKKIVKLDMGDLENGPDYFNTKIVMKTSRFVNIRSNALESARVTALRRLETNYGKKGFYFRIKAVPHQAIRENPLAAGAGADRLSTGMKHAFGKIIGMAAQLDEGAEVMEVHINEEKAENVAKILKLASKKLPVKMRIQIIKKNKK